MIRFALQIPELARLCSRVRPPLPQRRSPLVSNPGADVLTTATGDQENVPVRKDRKVRMDRVDLKAPKAPRAHSVPEGRKGATGATRALVPVRTGRKALFVLIGRRLGVHPEVHLGRVIPRERTRLKHLHLLLRLSLNPLGQAAHRARPNLARHEPRLNQASL